MPFLTTAARRWLSSGDVALLARNVPAGDSRQSSSRQALLECLRAAQGAPRVLDLGCGAGSSHDVIAAAAPRAGWVGVDIADSPEAQGRPRRDLAFVTFDGTRIPLAAGAFDVVYSHQVFEHVRAPEALLGEVARVLAAGGVFVGSTSQLEPFHSRSLWNYTPYGFVELLRAAGFRRIEIRPGIDGLTLTCRRVFSFVKLGRPFDFFFERQSPLNIAIELAARMVGLEPAARNVLKLVFAGQFVFVARKSESEPL
jgi:SAM-dependent methyltransferase